MQNTHHEILRTDVAGRPIEWINYQQAAKLYCLDQISYSLGPLIYEIRGGYNKEGKQSIIELNAIIATIGQHPNQAQYDQFIPPLSNRSLFKRDQNLCLYCGHKHNTKELSRDHILPKSRGGQDEWNNVVTACKRCNNFKAGRTPEESGLELIAIPFTPNRAEYVFLQGKRILADQMEFLLAQFPRHSQLKTRLNLC